MRIERECKLLTGLQYLPELNSTKGTQRDYRWLPPGLQMRKECIPLKDLQV
jgi:hypothetical protein